MDKIKTNNTEPSQLVRIPLSEYAHYLAEAKRRPRLASRKTVTLQAYLRDLHGLPDRKKGGNMRKSNFESEKTSLAT